MQQPVSVLGRISILAALSGIVLGSSADVPVRAEVQRVLASPYDVDDPDLAGFVLNFNLRLTNQSGRPVNLPKSGIGKEGSTRIIVPVVDAKQPDGRWQHIVQSSWYDTGNIKYESCKPLPPGRTTELANLQSGLLLLTTQVAGLGDTPVVRFGLIFPCRQPNGKVIFTGGVLTDEFELRLPARR